jgi:hypothetical protein
MTFDHYTMVLLVDNTAIGRNTSTRAEIVSSGILAVHYLISTAAMNCAKLGSFEGNLYYCYGLADREQKGFVMTQIASV